MGERRYSFTHSEPNFCNLYPSTISHTNNVAMLRSEVGVTLLPFSVRLFDVILYSKRSSKSLDYLVQQKDIGKP
jgi:hypothetical protein